LKNFSVYEGVDEMKSLKKIIALTTLMAFAASAAPLSAQQYVSDNAGYGYEQSRTAPTLTPAIALGAIALVAIIAVAVQNTSHGHSSSHSHSK
jgi:hypothetical protein